MEGDRLDISSDPSGPEPQRDAARPFLGIHFACCGVYARVYLNRQRNGYDGHCPRCLRPVRFRVGPGGSAARFYTAY